jgi:hypothetical protein
MFSVRRGRLYFRILLGLTCTSALLAESVPPATPPLAALLEQSLARARQEFSADKFLPDDVAATLIDLRHPEQPMRASVRGDVAIYPASVVKLFYLAAAHRWLEDGKLPDTPELRRAMKDMIVDSSNDATSYVVDVLTGTTSGPELPADELAVWQERRNAVNRYFAAAGYLGINANRKPWGDGPYGRETQAMAAFEPRRNALTTDATARLLTEIALRRCITPARSDEMLALLSRDPAKTSNDPDDQATFSGPALPDGAKLWSKAGWTSQTRHDAIFVELPNGARFVCVIFTVNHASQREFIRAVVRELVRGFAR